jgi:RNA polymerase sigma-70 factor (ECF subfamily)
VTDPSLPPESADAAAEAVYHELRRLAAAFMRRERPGQTLQATALVHEAYLRLADAGTPWKDRNHFIGVAARSMRQILVDRARARGAQKRWGGMDRVSLTDALVKANNEDRMLPALDEALTRLEAIEPELGRIVELRYFVGFTNEEIAAVLQISVATVKRRWALARAWLFRELDESAA